MSNHLERNPAYGYVMAPIQCPECGALEQPPFDPCSNCGYVSRELFIVPD